MHLLKKLTLFFLNRALKAVYFRYFIAFNILIYLTFLHFFNLLLILVKFLGLNFVLFYYHSYLFILDHLFFNCFTEPH